MFYNCPNIHSTLFVLQLNANRSELNVETLRKNLGNLLSVDAHYVVILEINQRNYLIFYLILIIEKY